MNDHSRRVRDAARITVCHFAADTPEARELMYMLGIYPGQEDDDNTIPRVWGRLA